MRNTGNVWTPDSSYKFLRQRSSLILEKIKGLKLALALVQELRLLSGLSFDSRSQADRFFRTADPQVLISEQE